MTFERSFDYETIGNVMRHRRIYRHISDDFAPPLAEFRPVEHPGIWYVLVRDNDELLGLWVFHPLNGICVEVHTCLLPCAWGERARRAAVEMIDWIWANTPWMRIVTNVPETNRLALYFAAAAGMKIYGVNHQSFLKGGELMDQVCLGISKPTAPAVEADTAQEVLTCQQRG